MTDQKLLELIVINPRVMTGKPLIKGTRLKVEFILNLLAHGSSIQDILGEYDSLKNEMAGFVD
jgi:uncharacterized protein (DUF433 family)